MSTIACLGISAGLAAFADRINLLAEGESMTVNGRPAATDKAKPPAAESKAVPNRVKPAASRTQSAQSKAAKTKTPTKLHDTANTSVKADSSAAWARGGIFGEYFMLDKAYYGKNFLFLRSAFKPTPQTLNGPADPAACNGIELILPNDFAAPGNSMSVDMSQDETRRPTLWYFVISGSGTFDGVPMFQKFPNTEGITLSLKFFGKTNGLLPGYIDLNCPRLDHSTHIKGYFYAEYTQFEPKHP